MGLFGSIFKVVGSVAKGVASKLTHGVSDQVLKLVKGRGSVKQVAASPDVSIQQQALVAKAMQGAKGPSVVRTAIAPLMKLYAPGAGSSSGGTKRAAGKPKALTKAQFFADYERRGYDGLEAEHDWRRYMGRKKSTKAELAADRVRREKASGSPAKARTRRKSNGRTPPRGGLDLKAISAMWKGEGKPGTWPNYVKLHSDVRIR